MHLLTLSSQSLEMGGGLEQEEEDDKVIERSRCRELDRLLERSYWVAGKSGKFSQKEGNRGEESRQQRSKEKQDIQRNVAELNYMADGTQNCS